MTIFVKQNIKLVSITVKYMNKRLKIPPLTYNCCCKL